ncbi:MAG TPA: WYL domain-containing protein [Campylobacterales bacterium]|nr:WYL domain-containing protein [Campylobacterales bacterium]
MIYILAYFWDYLFFNPKEFSQHLLAKGVSKAYLIKTHNFEDIGHKLDVFKSIEKAILNLKVVELVYRDQKRRVHPYKFANVKGIWYLIALQDEVIKTFTFTKISKLQIFDDYFVVDQGILEKIENEESLWFSNSKTEVLLKVDFSVAPYFKRRKVIPYQKILEEYEDGSLLVSVLMTFENEILQMVQYWLPNVKIVSPTTLQDKLEKTLLKFLNIT